jgi:hypothetical protein
MPVSNFENGISTAAQGTALGAYGSPDPTAFHQLFDDFNTYTSGNWTLTNVGTGTPILVAGDGGLLSVPTSGASADSTFLQKTTEGFSFAVGKPMWFKCRFKVSLLTSTLVIGLQVTDTTPLSVTDGIYWLSTTTTGALTLICRKNASTGSTSTSGGTLVADTYTELAWYWDGVDSVQSWQDGVQNATLTGVAASYLPDTTATMSFGVQTDTAAIKTMTLDYVFAVKQR